MNCCKNIAWNPLLPNFFFALHTTLAGTPSPQFCYQYLYILFTKIFFLWKLISLYWFPLCRCPETLTGLRCQFPNPFAKKISTGIYNSCFGMSAVYLRKVVWKDLKKIFYQTRHFKIIYYFLNNLSKPQCPQLNQK